MRTLSLSAVTLGAIAGLLWTATAQAQITEAIRPMTNPVNFDSPVPQTNVHPIFMYQRFPDMVETTLGNVPLDGDLQLYAVQIEYAFTENLSLIAVKDGYVRFSPDNDAAFSDESGWADLAAGLKYAFVLEDDFALAGRVVVELPTGDDDVWQGNGKGTITPSLEFVKLADPFQFSGTGGFIIPFDGDEEALFFYHSWHISYQIAPKIFPLIELTHIRTLNEGAGLSNFGSQVGGAVPSVAAFEGGDLVNLGAANADQNKDFVTIAIGARFRVTEKIDLGIAYEVPLTDDEAGLMDDRTTVDMVIRF